MRSTDPTGPRINVSIWRGGKAEAEISNQPRIEMFGKPFVRYQGRLYEVDDQGRIHIEPNLATAVLARPARKDARVGAKRRKDKPDKWSTEQSEVIASPIDRRLLVAAPPGSGKTATACCRSARLIEELGGDAHKLLVISFTKAAVEEFRSRIGLYLADPGYAHSIRITTLDAFAWMLYRGFDERAALTGSYEDNIRAALELVRTNEVLQQELRALRHLIVDEAQDFLGVRAELVMAIISGLSPDAGITVLGDEAQSIYGFSVEDEAERTEGEHLIDLVRKLLPSVDEVELEDIYRAETPSLGALIVNARKVVLRPDAATSSAISELVSLIQTSAQGNTRGLSSEVSDTSVILYRNRIEVLSAAFSENAPPARVRLSGHSQIVNPALAICLFDFTGPRLTRLEFETRWKERMNGSGMPKMLWETLIKLGGDGRGAIEMMRLRSSLRRKGLPPVLSANEIGAKGPLLSTIHAFKGREAPEVHLMLPRKPTESGNSLDEEARVLYVGASRAIRKLKVGEAKRYFDYGSEGGRVFQGYRKYRSARVEVGRDGDIDPEGMAGTAVYGSEDDALRVHTRLSKLRADDPIEAVAIFSMSRQKRYLLHASPEGQAIGALSSRFGRELWRIIEKVVGRGAKRKPGSEMRGIKVFGARSLVLTTDDPALETLHEPWRSSGFILAPVILGFPFNNSMYWKYAR